MFVRIGRTLYALAIFLLIQSPPLASARGVPIRGQVIVSNGTVTGTVSKCSCTDQWYTVGLRRGETTIVAKIKGHSGVAAPSFGIRVGLLRGSQTAGFAQAACLATQSHCRASTRISARLASSGAYYIKVSGLGSNGISYTLHIQGSIYRLR